MLSWMPPGVGEQRPGHRRAGLWRVLWIVLVAALLVGLAWFCGAGAGPRRKADRFLLIGVTEIDSAVLETAAVPGLWPGAAGPSAAIDPAGPRLTLDPGLRVPRGRFAALILWTVEDLDVRLAQELLPVRRLPFGCDLSRPLPATLPVDRSRRLAGGEVSFTSITADGALTLSHLGVTSRLGVNEAYARLWIEGPTGSQVYAPGEEWRAAAEAALSRAWPMSKLEVTNYGWCTAEQIEGVR